MLIHMRQYLLAITYPPRVLVCRQQGTNLSGVICLMYFGGLRRADAINLLRQRRPVVDIIGDFPILLSHIDDSFRRLRNVSLATTPWGLANCLFMKKGGLTEDADNMLEERSLDY